VIDVADTSSLSGSNLLSFKQILLHWAASTNQKKSHLTYLLLLLKEPKPLIDFDRLPCSGKHPIENNGTHCKVCFSELIWILRN
jgi:hypothetical protein